MLHSKEISKHSTFAMIRVGLSLLTVPERTRMTILAGVTFGVGQLEMVALASMMPLVAIILEPSQLEQWVFIAEVAAQLGQTEQPEVIMLLVTASVSLLVISTAAKIVVEYFISHLSASCRARLASRFAKKFLSVPYVWFLGQNSAILTRMINSDVIYCGQMFIETIMGLFGSIVLIGLSFSLVLILAPKIGFLVLGGVLTVAAFFLLFTRGYINRLSLVRRETSNAAFQMTQQLILGMKDIRLSSREDFVFHSFSNAVDRNRRAGLILKFLSSVPAALIILFGQILLLVVVLVLSKTGESPGNIVAQIALLVMVSSRVIPAINRFSGYITSLWKIFPFLEGLDKIETELSLLTESSDVGFNKQKTEEKLDGFQTVCFNDLDFRYPGVTELNIDNAHLKIESGKSYGIVGPSGAGKSTLVNVLLGLLHPTAGQILIDGKSLEEIGIKPWQRLLAYVPQDPLIFDDTIEANIAFGEAPEKVDRALLEQCIEMSQLSNVIAGLEHGLDTRLGEQGSRLSGGQRQRVSIARALYRQPQLLVLDEATSALDSESQAAIQQSIESLHGSVSMLIVAHRLDTIRRCDSIIVMNAGKIVANGDWDSLLESSPMFRSMLDAAGQRYYEDHSADTS